MPRLMGERLTGRQIRVFVESLLDAYSSLDKFDNMLLFYLDKNRPHITLARDLITICREVIETAEAESWTAELLVGAREGVPTNIKLADFAQQFGLSTQIPKSLEKIVHSKNNFIHIEQFRERLGALEGQVCRIEFPLGTGQATGFLVGPDALMTNYHALESVITGKIPSNQVAFRFDYKKDGSGEAVNEGTIHYLAQNDWLIDCSPYSHMDLLSEPLEEPGLDELDYALVRLEGEPGKEPIRGEKSKDPEAKPRGWVKIPEFTRDLEEGGEILILQHPKGQPLQLAFDSNSILKINKNGSRIRYQTNTRPGSSGSPCFDMQLNLIALHHLGDLDVKDSDLDEKDFAEAKFNQGIPISSIKLLLESRGKGAF